MTKKEVYDKVYEVVYQEVAKKMAADIQDGSYYCLFSGYCSWAGAEYNDDCEACDYDDCYNAACLSLDYLLESGYNLYLLAYSAKLMDSIEVFLALQDDFIPQKIKSDNCKYATITARDICAFDYNKEFVRVSYSKKKRQWLEANLGTDYTWFGLHIAVENLLDHLIETN